MKKKVVVVMAVTPEVAQCLILVSTQKEELEKRTDNYSLIDKMILIEEATKTQEAIGKVLLFKLGEELAKSGFVEGNLELRLLATEV